MAYVIGLTGGIGSGKSAATLFTWERTDKAAALKKAARALK